MDHQSFAQMLGSYGEFFGAIAVFATLAYLAVQVRQGAKAERRSALDASIRSLVAIRQAAIEDPELSALTVRGMNDPDSLDDVEWYRFRLLMYNFQGMLVS